MQKSMSLLVIKCIFDGYQMSLANVYKAVIIVNVVCRRSLDIAPVAAKYID